jgi:uncharacterized protein (TIGR02611 family)
MEPEQEAAAGWRARVASSWRSMPRPMRLLMAATGGTTLIVVGVVMLVLPGPGLLVIAMGVALLATEFAWAQHVMHHGRRHARRIAAKAKSAVGRSRTTDAIPIDPSPTTAPSTTREPS